MSDQTRERQLLELLREACGMLKVLDRKGQRPSVDHFLARAEVALKERVEESAGVSERPDFWPDGDAFDSDRIRLVRSPGVPPESSQEPIVTPTCYGHGSMRLLSVMWRCDVCGSLDELASRLTRNPSRKPKAPEAPEVADRG